MVEKAGFILGPKGKFTGALSLNEKIYHHVSKNLPIGEIRPESDFYYQIRSVVGYILNYFTLYTERKKYKYIIGGTNVATLPFLETANVLCMFHAIDSANYKIILDSLTKPNEKNRINKWIRRSGQLFKGDVKSIESDFSLLSHLESFAANKSEVITVVSPLLKKQLVDSYDIPSSKISVIFNGIDQFWFERKKTPPRKKPVLVFTSRTDNSFATFLIKGIDRACDVLNGISGIEKHVNIHTGSVGTDTSLKLQDFFRKATDAKIRTNVGNNQLANSYRPEDIFLGSSRAEACQLTLIEAMAAGMVPVCFPAGIVDYCISNGENGFIVSSPAEAIEKIMMISRDSSLRKQMSDNAHQTALKCFKIETMLKNYEDVILSFINKIL